MSSVARTAYQVGVQGAIGSPVAATRKLYGKTAFPNEDDNTEPVTQSRPNYQAVHDVNQTHRSATWKYEEELNFEEMPFWMQVMLQGSIAPSGSGPYTWAADSEDTATEDILTLEAANEVADVQMPDGICTKWEISGGDANGPKPILTKLEFIGSKVDDMAGGITSGIADRDLATHYGLFRNTSFYLDDAAGNIGNTAIAALASFSLKCDKKVQPNYPGGQSGLYTSFNKEKSYVEVMVELIMNATAYAEFSDKYANGTARFGRIHTDGAGNDGWFFDFHAARWHKMEFKPSGATWRVALMCQAAYDTTLGYAWQMRTVNGISSL